MSLDELLLQLRRRRLILINEAEIWPSPNVTTDIKRGLRRHREGLRVLLRWSSTDVCPARDLHRSYWRYAGGGNYICDVCAKIAC